MVFGNQAAFHDVTKDEMHCKISESGGLVRQYIVLERQEDPK